MSLQGLVDAVAVVEVVKAVRAVEVLKEYTRSKFSKDIPFFTENDFWKYHTVSDDRTCTLCMAYANMTFQGAELLTLFPYLEVVDANTIRANTHLPRDPNCRCWLSRGVYS